MDGLSQVQNHHVAPLKKLTGTDHSAAVEILLIGRDQIMRLYTDEVLRRAGFVVRSVAPWDAKNIVNDGVQKYPLVVFSHTLYPQDVAEIGTQLRRRCPGSKLLLMLGPDLMPVNFSMFDATIEGLEGPVALVKAVHRLTGFIPMDGSAGVDGSASLSA